MKQLDKESFNSYIENTARSVIKDYKLIEPEEKIVVGLSGGKDSVLTLYILSKFMDDFDFEMVAVSIDEGISGYRCEGIKTARKIARDLGVKLVEKSFKDEFGFLLDDISDFYKSSCIPCGVFRRTLLNKTAYQLGADKLATGHNMDDEIQSFLMSFARADFRRFTKFGPKLDKIHPKLVPRIKPLWKIPEKDVGTWAILNDIDVHFAECPYSHTSLRAKMKDHLNRLEGKRPGTKIAILESFDKTFKFDKIVVELGECELCGEPSSLRICKACEMVEDIKNRIVIPE
ncbi:MAG: TIGR00269 family protein [Methanobacterium paludis]|nr:TIGR00269 family protein [Methanobacterium paludis]